MCPFHVAEECCVTVGRSRRGISQRVLTVGVIGAGFAGLGAATRLSLDSAADADDLSLWWWDSSEWLDDEVQDSADAILVPGYGVLAERIASDLEYEQAWSSSRSPSPCSPSPQPSPYPPLPRLA